MMSKYCLSTFIDGSDDWDDDMYVDHYKWCNMILGLISSAYVISLHMEINRIELVKDILFKFEQAVYACI